MLKQILYFIKKTYYTSSSELFIKYLRKRGVLLVRMFSSEIHERQVLI